MVGVRRALPPVAAVALGVAMVAWASAAAAQSIINNPGDHVNSVELEPHLIHIPWDAPADGIGFGFRATVPILHNGFASAINNSIGIGFGLDWLHYTDGYCGYSDCGSGSFNHFMAPVVLQWNFFLSRRWSVFGEPGVALHYLSWGCPDYVDNSGNRSPGKCDSTRTHVDGVLFAGARWHLGQYMALTLRIGLGGVRSGWDTRYASIGISFL